MPANVAANEGGDWYGEHAGKWLVAAARAAVRSGDDALLGRVQAVADRLVGLQDADGYLGNYPPDRRFMVRQPAKPYSWNGEPALRTWDIWTHSYLILGLIEVWRATGDAKYLAAAARIGDLAWRTLTRARSASPTSVTILAFLPRYCSTPPVSFISRPASNDISISRCWC